MQTPPVSAAPKLLDQLRHQIRRLHYSIRTEDAYVHWVRFFIRFHGLRHSREMGAAEVEAFLTHLAVERKVSASTQNQALSAILFLYREISCAGGRSQHYFHGRKRMPTLGVELKQ